MQQGIRTRSIALCGLSIALLAVGAFISLPLGPVPFTLQTLMLVLVVLILTPGEALVTVGGYLLIGALGLPVFAGMQGGFASLAGPTGGFLIGFFVGTLIVSLLRLVLEKRARNLGVSLVCDIAAAVIICLVSYALGTFWFAVSTGTTVEVALAACVLPFVAPDVLKAVAAIACAQPVRIALGRAAWKKPDALELNS